MLLDFFNTDIHGKAELQARRAATQPLGSLAHAAQPAATHGLAAPQFHVSMNCLGGTRMARQVWRCAGNVHTESTRSSEGVALSLAENEDFLFATAVADERLSIERQSLSCYMALLQALAAHAG